MNIKHDLTQASSYHLQIYAFCLAINRWRFAVTHLSINIYINKCGKELTEIISYSTSINQHLRNLWLV